MASFLSIFSIILVGMFVAPLIKLTEIQAAPATSFNDNLDDYKPFYTQLKCVPGYSEPPLKVFTDAELKCSKTSNSSRTCHSYCLGRELKMITPKGLNKNELKRLLLEQLPGEGGKESVNSLMKSLSNCQVLIDELRKECDKQTRIWPCVHKAFTCSNGTTA